MIKKHGTTTKEERVILKQAAKIIQRELLEGYPVYIDNFGRFSVKEVKVNLTGLNRTKSEIAVVNTAHFRPFKGLKYAIRRGYPAPPLPQQTEAEEKNETITVCRSVPLTSTITSNAPELSKLAPLKVQPLSTSNEVVFDLDETTKLDHANKDLKDV